MTFKNVYVIGVFDLFHRGHLEFLREAKKYGENLIVAINSDELVAKYKRRPFISERDRLEIIKALKFVDYAFIIDCFDNKEYLLKHKINAIIHGDDWPNDDYERQICVSKDFLEKHDIHLMFIKYFPGVSTTEIIKKIKES